MTRAWPAIVAFAALGVIGIGSLGAGVAVVVLAGDLEGVPAGAVALTAGALAGYGVLALAGAAGLWRGASWAWGVGLAVSLLGLLAIVVAALGGAFEPPLLAGVVVYGMLGVALASPTLRPYATGREPDTS